MAAMVAADWLTALERFFMVWVGVGGPAVACSGALIKGRDKGGSGMSSVCGR